MQHGFELFEERTIPEQKNTLAKVWVHKKTGARVLSCSNTDRNKVFGVTFRTPVSNSTGVPHILEHSVLCGSQKYPTKEPFVELLKSSLQTFLNAFTYPDKTCYPVASTNLQDFYNLMDVYLDAVFYPHITEDIFKQEGWHIEAYEMNKALSFKGVVYNEMKGVYSSVDSILAEKSQNSIFPDITYALDSGGEPSTILTLSYEQFKNFHASYYHPSNARFFFWGDDNEDTRLRKLSEVLDAFEKQEIHSTILLQEHFDTPKNLEFAYQSELEDNATFVTFNWLLPETTDVEVNFALEILDFILLGMPGSPLRKALIDSELGTDLTGGGLHNDLRQMYFSIGLKEIQKDDVTKIEQCIFDCLKKLVQEGIEQKYIDAAFNNIEFSLRENNTSHFPVGLAVMVRCLTTWLYDASPFLLLEFEHILTSLKTKKSDYYVHLLQKYFLDNSSRSTVVLVPDATLEEKKEKEEALYIESIEKTLSREEKKAYIEETQRFLEKQALPDSPEALASIPVLSLQDINRKEKEDIYITDSIHFNPLDTSGVLYATFYLSLHRIRTEDLPLLSLFSRALLEMGTTTKEYTDLGIEISSSLGDLDIDPSFFVEYTNYTVIPTLAIDLKTTYSHVEKAQDLIIDILSNPQFNNKERFLKILLEEKARAEQSLIPSGHSTVLSRLFAHCSYLGRIEESISGVTNLQFLRKLINDVSTNWDAVLSQLQEIHSRIVVRNDLLINTTAEEIFYIQTKDFAMNIKNALSLSSYPIENLFPEMLPYHNEAFITTAQVNYMGKAANLYDLGYTYHGSVIPICKHLRMNYLWEKVRVQGGAYGVFIICNQATGFFAEVSYRDPNTKETLAIFDNTTTYLQKLSLSEKELERAIIGAIGSVDTYLLPDAKGKQAFIRYLTKETLEMRQTIRDQIFSTTIADFKRFGEILSVAKEKSIVVALGGTALKNMAQENNYTCTFLDKK
ncbi:MAG: insulinase family protein [Desulfovibrionaceae bacterium]